MRATSVSGLIGRTPLLEVALRDGAGTLLVKLEKFNPGGSMKDRMARSMIDEAERSLRLLPRGTIVESSSGNTGAALAMLAAERGYRFIAVVDHHASREKVRTMRAYGAEIVRVEGGREDEVATLAREALARSLAESEPGAVFLNQADNPSNAAGYEDAMAEELIADTSPGEVDILVGSVGTGGSLSGTVRGLRRRGVTLRVVGVEPAGSIIFGGAAHPYYQSGTGTPGGVLVGANVDYSVIDEGRTVTDAEAFTTARFLARRRGLLVGGAAGGVILTALRVLAEEDEQRTALAIVADGGEKYLDTVFDDAWLQDRGLFDEALDTWLSVEVGARRRRERPTRCDVR